MEQNTKPKKVYNVKPKQRHRNVVKKLSENVGITQALKESGYSDTVAETKQTHVTNSKGFRLALEEAGLTKEFLNNALYEDIKNKPKSRIQELTLAYRLRGDLTERQQDNRTLILITSAESAKRYKVDNQTDNS